MRASFIVPLLSALIAGPVLAQHAEPRAFPLERFRPAIDQQGLLDTEWGGVPGHLVWGAGLWLGYANDPFVINREVDGETERVAALVGHRVSASLVASLGLYEWIQLGLELPLALYQGRDDEAGDYNRNLASLSAAGIGDLRLAPKVRLLRQARHLVDLALIANLSLPTASSRGYLGERGVAFFPEVAASRALFGGIRLAANLGYRARQRTRTANLVVDDELSYRAAVAYDFAPLTHLPLEAAASLSGSTSAKVPFQRLVRSPLEALLGATYKVAPGTWAVGGGGVGLLAGYATPDFRLFAGVRFGDEEVPEPTRIGDSDGDGLLDDVDQCPSAPEDRDQFEDENGCPDPDNDQDGVPDVDDGAPNDPEDLDQFADQDGVPDPDNDGDGVLDVDDRCPNEAENRNGYEDEDGCPEEIPDTDADGIADPVDTCPNEPEDRDQFEDVDGCPDPDNDQDTVLDQDDKCPLVVGVPDNAGCPDVDRDGDGTPDRIDNCPDEPGPAENSGCQIKQLVKLTKERIEILEMVYFDTGLDTIQQVSFGLLDNIAQVMQQHPELELVRIEGHTDDRGAADFNRDLSQRRAEAVRRYLIDKGVSESRLVAKGFGEDKPIASNKNSKGRAANRRVEFNLGAEAQPQ